MVAMLFSSKKGVIRAAALTNVNDSLMFQTNKRHQFSCSSLETAN